MDNLFSTHPAVENRVRALQQIATEMQRDRHGLRYGGRPAPRGSSSALPTAGSSWRVPQFGDHEGSGGYRGPWG
jgi:heat shock protein HtpX